MAYTRQHDGRAQAKRSCRMLTDEAHPTTLREYKSMVRKEMSRRGFAKNIGLGAVAEVGASSCRATGMAGHKSRADQLKTSIHHFRMRQAEIRACLLFLRVGPEGCYRG